MLLQDDKKLVCSCVNDIFITHGDEFGFTLIECIKCGDRIPIVKSTLKPYKLLSPYGEDYCRVYGCVLGEGIVVDYLVFTEFDTKVIISIEDRIERIKITYLTF